MVKYLEQSYRVSERHACCVLEVARATHRYEGHQEQWIELRMRIREIAQTRVRYGYRMIRVLLNREGWKVGKDLVYRLYKEEGLGLRKRPAGKRRAAVHRRERLRPTGPNQVWAMDFVADQLSDGRRIRSLTIVDIFTRESLAIEVGQSLKGGDVVRVLNQLKPATIRQFVRLTIWLCGFNLFSRESHWVASKRRHSFRTHRTYPIYPQWYPQKRLALGAPRRTSSDDDS